jgi:hypothetical protein
MSSSRSSKKESDTEEARLDALLKTRPSSSHISGKALPSRIDQSQKSRPSSSNTSRNSLPSKIDGSKRNNLPSKLDSSKRDGLPSKLDSSKRDALPSKLDSSRRERLPSKLDPSKRHGLPSKLDSSRRENLPSKLDPSRRDGLSSKLDSSKRDKMPSQLDDKVSVKTAFTDPHDIKMASRQTKYDTLPEKEKKKQNDWAQTKLSGVCPAGYDWLRVPGGYNCDAGNHWMTDELLAEGRHGYLDGPCGGPGDTIVRRIGFSKGLDSFSEPIYPSKEEIKHAEKMSKFHKGLGPNPGILIHPLQNSLYQFPKASGSGGQNSVYLPGTSGSSSGQNNLNSLLAPWNSGTSGTHLSPGPGQSYWDPWKMPKSGSSGKKSNPWGI